ncbi:hypothetical protein BDQ12DRAFT_665467 [Crucibulum laeve]|uniref:Uncharacterized protein n=1 Tax=Crucibulum laeve TaxID=68775 RepID=A0A5C3M5J5_9AGAR|nr:hypothetical protein BDQ12DRAFT_665467 [Crucibulum laeve]
MDPNVLDTGRAFIAFSPAHGYPKKKWLEDPALIVNSKQKLNLIFHNLLDRATESNGHCLGINQQPAFTQDAENWKESIDMFTMWMPLLEKCIPTEDLIYLLDLTAEAYSEDLIKQLAFCLCVSQHIHDWPVTWSWTYMIHTASVDDDTKDYVSDTHQLVVQFLNFISTLKNWEHEYPEIGQHIHSKELVAKWEFILQRMQYYEELYQKMKPNIATEFQQLTIPIRDNIHHPNGNKIYQMAIKQICQIPELEDLLRYKVEQSSKENEVELLVPEGDSESSEEDKTGWWTPEEEM